MSWADDENWLRTSKAYFGDVPAPIRGLVAGWLRRQVVGTLVARGECDLGFQQLSELISLRDIQLLGPLPTAIQSMTVFSAALSADCRDAAAARKVLAWLASSATLAVKQRFGLEAASGSSSQAA